MREDACMRVLLCGDVGLMYTESLIHLHVVSSCIRKGVRRRDLSMTTIKDYVYMRFCHAYVNGNTYT